MARGTLMTKPAGDLELDDVLDAYMAEAGTPNWSSLAVWVRRYPQYERELMEFAATWARMEWAPLSRGNEVDEDTLVLRGMSVVQNLLHEHRQTRGVSSDNVGEAPSIVVDAQRNGMD